MNATGFRSWDEQGNANLTEDIQADSTDFITHTDQGVWANVALHLSSVEPGHGYPGCSPDMTLSIGYGDAGHFGVTLEPDVARSLAAMLLRGADVLDERR